MMALGNWYDTHADLINIGGISGLIPSTGVTFPFPIARRNSLLVLSVAIALVLNIDANERRDALYEQMGSGGARPV